LLLLLCHAGSIDAQERPELFSKVERVFREKEPAWKVDELIPGDTSDPVKQRLNFSSGRGRASVNISIWMREKDARDVFAAESFASDNSAAFVSEALGRKIEDDAIKSSLPELGDENHMRSYRSYPRRVIIQFRKGNVIVRVDSSTERVAKRFARHVFEQIAAG
jgi:hypothetical protein